MLGSVLKNIQTVELFGFDVYADLIESISFDSKLVINTINAHSYNTSFKDNIFHKALVDSDILLPDGASMVFACKLINNSVINKIAGYDIFYYILNSSINNPIKCFFLGSASNTLFKIKNRIKIDFPNVSFCGYSPPFKDEFSEEDNMIMREKINEFQPDFLFVGMTAPKQEKWTYLNKKFLDVNVICNIGAVFDFYARTTKRAPKFFIKNNIEWVHRSLSSTRLMKRYLVSNPMFIYYLAKEYGRNKNSLPQNELRQNT